MGERLHRGLTVLAVVLTMAWVGWGAYDHLMAVDPGDRAYAAGERWFEDADYSRALEAFDRALSEAPDHLHAQRGRARALMQLGRHDKALAAFDQVVRRAPDFAVSYANRGILLDRMGRYREAVQDYERALALDPELADGPGLITRFFRLQPEKPATIDRRARYLRAELAKPEADRTLSLPERDAGERPYRL